MTTEKKVIPKLDRDYLPKIVQKGIKKFRVTVDSGSTGTRMLTYKKVDLSSEELIIPSDYAEIATNIDHIKSKSNKVIDNLEIIITDITVNKEDKMFETKHLVRGTILNELKDLTRSRMKSSIGKRDQVEFYINSICCLGISLACRETNDMFEDYKVDFTMSVRPEDTRTIKRINTIKKRMAGIYKFELPRLGFSVNIIIPEELIFIDDESQANLRYHAVENSVSTDVGTYLMADVGGTSTDVALMENGVLIKSFSKSLPIGGNKIKKHLENYIIDDEDELYDGLEPSDSMLESALETGVLQDGDDTVDVKKGITHARKLFALEAFNGIMKIFDNTPEYSVRQVNGLVCAGGPFGKLDGVVDLREYIGACYKQVSPKTDVQQIAKRYPIIYGLMYWRISLEGPEDEE